MIQTCAKMLAHQRTQFHLASGIELGNVNLQPAIGSVLLSTASCAKKIT